MTGLFTSPAFIGLQYFGKSTGSLTVAHEKKQSFPNSVQFILKTTKVIQFKDTLLFRILCMFLKYYFYATLGSGSIFHCPSSHNIELNYVIEFNDISL